MKILFKKVLTVISLMAGVSAAQASICNIIPGSVTCGLGTVENLNGNGTVMVNGTTVSKATQVNGLLSAEDANFNSLDINGSVKMMQCTINDVATIKGSLSASSTKFERRVDLFSSEARLINSKIASDLHLGHSDSPKQTVYLDNFSEVAGNIIFDDGAGEVILRGKSTIGGKVIGGRVVSHND